MSLNSFNGLGAASSACGNDPPELLGVSAGLPPMPINSNLPRTPIKSPRSKQLFYPNHPGSDYNCPQDLDLLDQHGAHHAWEGYQVNCNHEQVADPLQRLASAEPEQLPWSGIHLNGVPTSLSTTEPIGKSCSNSRNIRIAHQQSATGSRANETDDSGYHTYSQVDNHSNYSGTSHPMHQFRASPSSIPRTMPPIQGQPGYFDDDDVQHMGYEFRDPREARKTSPALQEPLRCGEIGCSFNCKTNSDFKYVVTSPEHFLR